MRIGGLEKNTLIDFPGRLSCTVFFTGCNFRCPFCYSRELVLPEKIKEQPIISEEEFFNFLKQRKEFLEGVVLCGGEPTIDQELIKFIKKIKSLGFLVKLDTNGSNPEMIEQLIDEKLIDYIAMDVKAPKEKYGFYSGKKADLKKIEQSVDLLKKGRVDFEFRTTLAPGLNIQDIKNMANWLAGENVHPVKSSQSEVSPIYRGQFNGVKYFLQEFNNQKPVLNPEILKMPALQFEEIEKLVKEIKDNFEICQLRQ